jgi:hypothetical protein
VLIARYSRALYNIIQRIGIADGVKNATEFVIDVSLSFNFLLVKNYLVSM